MVDLCTSQSEIVEDPCLHEPEDTPSSSLAERQLCPAFSIQKVFPDIQQCPVLACFQCICSVHVSVQFPIAHHRANFPGLVRWLSAINGITPSTSPWTSVSHPLIQLSFMFTSVLSWHCILCTRSAQQWLTILPFPLYRRLVAIEFSCEIILLNLHFWTITVYGCHTDCSVLRAPGDRTSFPIHTPPNRSTMSITMMTSTPYVSICAAKQRFLTNIPPTCSSAGASPPYSVFSPFNIVSTCLGPLGCSPLSLQTVVVITVCWKPISTRAFSEQLLHGLLICVNGSTSSVTAALGSSWCWCFPLLFSLLVWAVSCNVCRLIPNKAPPYASTLIWSAGWPGTLTSQVCSRATCESILLLQITYCAGQVCISCRQHNSRSCNYCNGNHWTPLLKYIHQAWFYYQLDIFSSALCLIAIWCDAPQSTAPVALATLLSGLTHSVVWPGALRRLVGHTLPFGLTHSNRPLIGRAHSTIWPGTLCTVTDWPGPSPQNNL